MAKKKARKKFNIKEKLHRFFGNAMAIIAVILVVAVFGGTYFFVIAPNMISKPFIEKPILLNGALDSIKAGEHVINSSHINYIINEIGAYKLKCPFATENYPIIEFLIKDTNKRYYSYVNNNVPKTKEGNPKNEDIIIKSDQETVAGILESENIIAAVKESKAKGKIEVELTADMKTLAAKGYLSIYENLK